MNYIFRRNRRITQQGLRKPSENPNFITASVVKNQPRERIKSRFPINIINESESQDIEQQHDSIPILSEYRTNIRETDNSIKEILTIKLIGSKIVKYNYDNAILNTNYRLRKIRENPVFFRNILYDIEILPSSQYLTIEEISLFIVYLNQFLYDMLLTFTKTPLYYDGSNIIYRDPEPLPIYDNIVRLYEVIFYDIYNTFDIDYKIYNRLMKEMDIKLKQNKNSTLSDEKKIREIKEIYINFFIDCLLLTPLTKMGNYDNTITFFINYLAFLSIFTTGTEKRFSLRDSYNEYNILSFLLKNNIVNPFRSISKLVVKRKSK